MSELKTLKDLNDEERKAYEKVGEDYGEWIDVDKLKAEAIKRIKKNLKTIKKFVELVEIGEEGECVWKFLADLKYIKYDIGLISGRVCEAVQFFNIEMEDLK